MFLFSEYWRNKSKFPIAIDNRISVGYPYLERMATKIKSKKEIKTYKNILFLSSGPIGDRLANIAIGLQKLLDNNKYHIIFKLHPGEYAIWKERYPVLIKSGIEVIDNNKINLYELFAKSDIQVSGFNSTTIFEGLYFSLQTYILDYCVAKEISELCITNMAYLFENAEELTHLILKNEKRNIIGQSMFWEKNALQNVIEHINKIISGKV